MYICMYMVFYMALRTGMYVNIVVQLQFLDQCVYLQYSNKELK
jgi:hypothetical protein